MIGTTIRTVLVILGTALCTAGFELKSTPNEVQSFLGNASGKLVFALSNDTHDGIYCVDYAQNTGELKRICTEMPDARSLIIHPEGGHILYSVDGEIYVRTLVENSPSGDRRRVATGTFPKWWKHPTNEDWYVIYSRQTGSKGIYCQKLNADLSVAGAATKLFDEYRAGGGRSPDGRFLAAHGFAYMWEIEPAGAVENASVKTTVVFRHTDAGNCYGFMSPAADPTSHHYGSVLHFNGGHTLAAVWKFAPDGKSTGDFGDLGPAVLDSAPPIHSYPVPPGDQYAGLGWKTITWSTHQNYAVVIGLFYNKDDFSDNRRRVYLVNMHEESLHLVLEAEQTGTLNCPHLWVEDGTAETVHAAITASPSRGTAPLTVRFDASASTGTNLSYTWEFGDGHTTGGISPEHTYTTPGTYTAVLIAAHSGASDTARTDITVDAASAVPARMDVFPTCPARVQADSTITFSAEVYDSDGKLIPDRSPSWSVHGTGGGTISSEGVYTAGGTEGRNDTVTATVNDLSTECRVEIVGDAIVLTTSFEEQYLVGDTLTVTWTTDLLRVSSVIPSVSPNNGVDWYTITQKNAIMSSDDSWGEIHWVIPEEMGGESLISENCRIRIHDYYENHPPAVSAKAFEIRHPAVSVNHSRTDAPYHKMLCRTNGISLRFFETTKYRAIVMDLKGKTLAQSTGNGTTLDLGLPSNGSSVVVLRIETPRETFRRKVVLR